MSTAVMERTLPFSATTPIHVARVGLKSRDAEQLATYYKTLLGLKEMGRGDNRISLGAGGRELLEIEGSAALQADDPRSAGLFHTAFLLPTRADLARWTRHARDNRFPIEGASDHLVSEALYLTDPEGNGIEIYADRDRKHWTVSEGMIQMATKPLDFRGLMAELDGDDADWKGAPQGSVVGHVHTRVGELGGAEKWWNETIGLDTVLRYGGGAVFLSSGGYHHHIGANIWQSRGAGPRAKDTTGLSFIELASDAAVKTTEVADPWGTAVRIAPTA